LKTILRIQNNGLWQDLGESDLPLAVGISSEGAILFGDEAESEPAAWFGSTSQQVFLQPVTGAHSTRLNRKLLHDSTWLAENDDIQINNTSFKVQLDKGVIVLSPVSPRKEPVLTPPQPPTKESTSQPADQISTEPVPPEEQIPSASNAVTPSLDSVLDTKPEQASIDTEPSEAQQNTNESKISAAPISIDNASNAKPVRAEQVSSEPELSEAQQASSKPEISEVPSFSPIAAKRNLSLLRYLVFVGFTILLLCVILVLIAVPVRVNITPLPDSTSLRGLWPSVMVKDRYFVLPGNYHIVAYKEGYHQLEEPLNVTLGSDSTLDFELLKLPGLLDIVSRPVTGAQVQVDGRVIGITPLEPIELEAGRYELRIYAERYLPSVQSLEVQGMGVRQQIDVTLEPGWGTLRIESQPDGADVLLNGKLVGQTPLKAEPVRGEYKLHLRKDGWKPILTNLKIEPGETIKLPLFELQKVDGIIELTSSPAGANVLLNGDFRGHTPLILTMIPEHDHQLSLTKSGFITASQSIRIGSGKTQSIEIQLKPEYGIVFIFCQPADAELTVDSKAMGAASRRLSLTTLSHQIEVHKAGYEPFVTTLTPTVGISKTLHVQLKSTRQAMDDAMPPEMKTADGQVLRRILLTDPVKF